MANNIKYLYFQLLFEVFLMSFLVCIKLKSHYTQIAKQQYIQPPFCLWPAKSLICLKVFVGKIYF